MSNAKQGKTLRLHVGEETVWLGDDRVVARDSGVSVPEFFVAYERQLAEATTIRLTGSRRNAALILGLRQRFPAGTTRLLLANPYICRTKAARKSPADVLLAMWQPEASSRLPGCWHDLSGYDCGTYAMWDEFDRHEVCTAKLLYLGSQHPAWKVVTFVPEYNQEAACLLLMFILDPRWYTHPSRPHRFSKLHAHLGLTPKNTRQVMEHVGSRDGGWNYHRTIAAVGTWYNLASMATFQIGEATTPGHFLWRIFMQRQSEAHGLTAATKRLVNLICFVWLESLTAKQGDRYFQPSSFFRTVEEALAFRDHLAEPPEV